VPLDDRVFGREEHDDAVVVRRKLGKQRAHDDVEAGALAFTRLVGHVFCHLGTTRDDEAPEDIAVDVDPAPHAAATSSPTVVLPAPCGR
jgi:hypothetical protein